MTTTRDDILSVLGTLALPDGGTLVSRDMVRAVSVEEGVAKFVIEAPTPDVASKMSAIRDAAEAMVAKLPGIQSAFAILTAHGPAEKTPPPNLKIGRHPTPQESGPARVPGVDRVLAIGSGKGGVGKSTVSSNLAVALAKQGRRVGLLDADIYGPSQPRMMGVSKRPGSSDGKTIIPLQAHGVTMMSIGLMVDPAKAVVWRGPMLMGALQQMLGQVEWGDLDVLIIDLPPGTGDVQLTLCQRYHVDGAVIVSTPQDVALIDARKALDMFQTLNTPVAGLIENMSMFTCPTCGTSHDIFGKGGVEAEAQALGLPFLGALPIDLETRLAGDGGTPIAAGDGQMAAHYAQLAQAMVDRNLA